ncbi:MAG TPA: RidA family protein [Trueperaceae bacterium]|jgi:enamine deaminase RidA (YjgF/YER057c/UK114 family)
MTPGAAPYPPADGDRREIWTMLVERDIAAFVAGDWRLVADDFVEEGFQGIDAGLQADPAAWRLRFPVLADYRDDWLRQSRETLARADAEAVRRGLRAATELRDIEVAGASALARKVFDGELRLRDGTAQPLRWQTLYRCRKAGGRWRIVGFVGYLPYPMGSGASSGSSATGPATRAPAVASAFASSDDAGAGGAAEATPAKRLPPGASQHATAGPYSPVLEVDPGRLVVISGQAALAADGSVVGDDVPSQARATLANCAAALASAGCGLADVFKVNVYLTDLRHWQAFNDVYAAVMPEPRPVRTAVQAGLLPGLLVEVEMWAVRPPRPSRSRRGRGTPT